MGIGLRTNYKKVIFGLVASSLSVGVVTPLNYLQAETIIPIETNAQAKVDVEAEKNTQETQSSKQSMTVGKTTITYDGISEKEYSTGSESNGSTSKKTVFNMTLEREAGFNNAKYVCLDIGFTVNVDGSEMRIYSGEPVEMTKVSDTKVTVAVPITGVTQKRTNRVKYGIRDITAELLKGIDAEVDISKIHYRTDDLEWTFGRTSDKGHSTAIDVEEKTVNWKLYTQETQSSKQSMTVGETTITYDGISEKEYSTGSESNGSTSKKTVFNMTLEREAGFNNAKYVCLDIGFTVNVDGSEMRIYSGEPVEMTKVSDTKVTVAVPITGVTQKRTNRVKYGIRDITAELLKGIDAEVDISEIHYRTDDLGWTFGRTSDEGHSTAIDMEGKTVTWKL